ncbi:uncharacterized protein [Malus domestica]|uniref:uncharacterized protein n=1 Tax=Malus domestica TaxID=3750 RepID=UPI00397717D9
MVRRSSHNWKKEIYEVQSSTQVDKQVMTRNELFDVVVNSNEELQITHNGVNEDGDDEKEEEYTDNELIDSDYEQEEEDDILVAQFEEQLYEKNDNMFVENVDNPIEKEPEEMGLIGEISDDETLLDDLDSIVDSEEDEEGVEVINKRRRHRAIQMPKFKQWKMATDLQDPKFEMGMLFPNKEQLKEVIVHYSCKNGRRIWFKKNDDVRIRVNYENGCPFLLYGDPDWAIEAFKAAVKRDYGQEVLIQQIYRARQRAEKANKGSWVKQYNKLGQYVEVLKETNLGSAVVLKIQMRGNVCKFQRIYICFDACKKRFKEGCRPVIGLDGCFVKGQHLGQILAAVRIDENNEMFPVAYAIVEIENQST